MVNDKNTKNTKDEIQALKQRIKELKEKGSFKAMYKELRTKSVDVMRDKTLGQQEKKEALATVCIKIADDFKNRAKGE